MTPATYLKGVYDFQDYCKKQEQIDCPVTHEFAPGVYMRTIFMPKGTFVIGKSHKTEHFNIVHTGKCRLMMDGEVSLVEAPHMFVSKPGVKKILMILEDMNWSTVHPTDETDLEILEAEHVLTEEEEKGMIDYFESLNLIEEQEIKDTYFKEIEGYVESRKKPFIL
jgi:hypothetical protein